MEQNDYREPALIADETGI